MDVEVEGLAHERNLQECAVVDLDVLVRAFIVNVHVGVAVPGRYIVHEDA